MPIKFGDVVDMTSRVSEFRRSSFDVEHNLSVDGQLAVEGGETRAPRRPAARMTRKRSVVPRSRPT
jgi:acyl-CoA thioesterase FadM